MSLSLITDRSISDLTALYALRNKIKSRTATVAEWSEWLDGSKGAYNSSDLERVDDAIQYLADLLSSYGYSVSVSPKTDWTLEDIPTPAQMESYLDDIRALRAALAVLPTTPNAPGSMDKLGITEANGIEKILLDIDTLITNMTHTIDLGWALGIAHIGLYGGIA